MSLEQPKLVEKLTNQMSTIQAKVQGFCKCAKYKQAYLAAVKVHAYIYIYIYIYAILHLPCILYIYIYIHIYMYDGCLVDGRLYICSSFACMHVCTCVYIYIYIYIYKAVCA